MVESVMRGLGAVEKYEMDSEYLLIEVDGFRFPL